MAAIVGKDNVIFMVRYNDLPYWKIFDNETKRTAGNYVARSQQEPDLGLELSLSDLSRQLDMLQPGRYLFVATKTSSGDKRGGMDTHIEIGVPTSTQSAISGTAPAVGGFFMEGVGQITPDNFDSAIEAKIKKIRQEEKAAEELAALKAENAELKAQKVADDTVFRNGLLAIGTTVWPVVKKSPVVAELMGTIGGLINAASAGSEASNSVSETGSVSGMGDEQARSERALETLAHNNAGFVDQLEMLAKLRQTNPEMFNQGIDMIKTLND